MKGFGKFLRGAAKVLSFLLLRLGLWVPAAFTLLFFIVLAVTGTSFTQLWGVYVFGLITTLVFAVIFVFLTTFRRLGKRLAKKRENRSAVAESKPKKGSKVSFVEGADPERTTATEFVASMPEEEPFFPLSAAEPPENFVEPVRRYDADPMRGEEDMQKSYDRNEERLSGSFLPYNNVANPVPTETNHSFIPYHRNDDIVRQSQSRGFSGRGGEFAPRESFRVSAPSDEKPMIFRTRMDPNMLIYEYSDRLDFYRIEPSGPVLVSSEPKRR